MGSASELECFLLLSRDLGLIEAVAYEARRQETTEVKKMLAALMREPRARLSQVRDV